MILCPFNHVSYPSENKRNKNQLCCEWLLSCLLRKESTLLDTSLTQLIHQERILIPHFHLFPTSEVLFLISYTAIAPHRTIWSTLLLSGSTHNSPQISDGFVVRIAIHYEASYLIMFILVFPTFYFLCALNVCGTVSS